MKRAHALAAIGLAAALSACSQQDLYARLSERQANEMVAALRNAGIEARKDPRDANLFSVSVPQEHFAQAIEVLRIGGFPHEGFDTLGQVFKKEGFVSSPLEERARLTHALSQEISNTIASIDGVVVARVHLSVPERDTLSDKQPPASASVFIKHRSGIDLSSQVGQIKALVVNSIQELPYDKVTVVLFPAEPMPPRAPEVPLHNLPPPLWLAGVLGVAGLLCGGGLLWLQGRRQRKVKERGLRATSTTASARAPGRPRNEGETR